MTAVELLAWLVEAGCRLEAVPGRLTVTGRVPPPLATAPRVLQTGVRAALTGRPWYGIDGRGYGTGPGRDGTLDPAARLPPGTVLLTVAGDPRWDRISPDALTAHPHLFARPSARSCGRSVRGDGGATVPAPGLGPLDARTPYRLGRGHSGQDN